METNLEPDCCPVDHRAISQENEDGRHFGKLGGKQDFDNNRCESGYKSMDEGFNSGSTCLSERVSICDEHKLFSVTEDDEKGSTIESIDEGISSINLSTELLQTRRNDSEHQKLSDRELLCRNAFHQDEDGDTHLHLTIIQLLESLSLHVIALAIDPDYLSIQNNFLQTPLHLAVITKQPLLVRKLITAGAEVDIRDHWGNTPLHIACKEGEALIGKLILQPVTPEETKSNSYKIQPTQNPQNLEARNYEGQVCLHLAAERGHCEILEDLIRNGANINARDGKSGRTILHYAAESGSDRMVQFLLCQDGIDVNSETYGGLTPLKLAKGRCHTSIVKMLKDRGAYYYSDASSEDDEMETESISDDYAIGGKPVHFRE